MDTDAPLALHRSFTMRRLPILAIAGLLLGASSRADADMIYYFAQITCAPEIEQFSIRPYFQYNVPTKFFEQHEDGPTLLAQRHGIYTAFGLSKTAYECDIKRSEGQDIHVVVVGETNGNGPIKHDQERLIVTVNDKEVAHINMGLRAPLPAGYISVQGNGLNVYVTTCSLSGEEGKENGKRIFLPADQGKCRVAPLK